MTSIYELRNEVAINCKRVRRSPVRERSLIIELKRLLVEVPELADALGTAPASKALTANAKYGLAGATHFAFTGSPDTIPVP